MVSKNRVQSRLLRVFLAQLVLISVVTICTVFAASYIAKNLLVNKALQGEADFFWENRAKDASFPLAASLNLTGYLSTDLGKPPPPAVRGFAPGQYQIRMNNEDKIVHVSEQGTQRLYLFFDGGTVSTLALYFGILPLIFVLLVMYGLSFLTYLLSKRAVSPISRLARKIENFDLGNRDAEELDLGEDATAKDAETRILVNALEHFVERSQASIERERNFTRYASHELRTPLAVIQGSASSLDLLKLEGASGRAVERIKRTSRQMSDLLNTLLLLAREQPDNNTVETSEVNQVVNSLLTHCKEREDQNHIKFSVEHKNTLLIDAPESLLLVVFGNLIDNACHYTVEGDVRVAVDSASVTVTDTGQGIDAIPIERIFEPFYRGADDDGEHLGLGLAIVKKTCDNYGWKVSVKSTPGEGSQFRIDFPITNPGNSN